MATHSYGLTFTFSGVTAQVTELNVGGISISAVEFTHLASTGAAKEFMAGLIDSGEVTVTLNMVKAHYSALLALARTTATGTIVLPGGLGTFSCAMFWTNLGTAVPLDDRITNDVTFKLTGLPTFA